MEKNHGSMEWTRGRMLGRGSTAKVYLGTIEQSQSQSQQLLAIKTTSFSSRCTLQKERNIYDYIEDCPNIIQCYGDEVSVEYGRSCYNLLLEYASGGSLADRIKQCDDKGLPLHETRRYTKDILRGLSHIHGQNMVHCDIKPENILLARESCDSKSYVAKIGDFGSAKRVRDDVPLGSTTETPLYLAPESIAYYEYEPPSDVWALGCVVLEMLTGKPAWYNGGKSETSGNDCLDGISDSDEKRRNDILHVLSYSDELPMVPTELPRNAQDFVKRCLVRETRNRWNVDELLSHPFVAEDHNEEAPGLKKTSEGLGLWLTLGFIGLCIINN